MSREGSAGIVPEAVVMGRWVSRCIRCWDTVNFREVYRMTAGTGGKTRAEDLCVWSLLVLRSALLLIPSPLSRGLPSKSIV